MKNPYTIQALPNKEYLELVGTAMYSFDSNNAFIIENLLYISDYHDWWELIDQESGSIQSIMESKKYRHAFQKNDQYIIELFHDLTIKRNRIVHSFPVTSYKDSDDPSGQILYTKEKDSDKQFPITKEYLIDFIRDNSKLSQLLYNLRDNLEK